MVQGAAFFFATFALVFLMGLQSRVVNSGQYVPAAALSAAIGAAQIFVVRTIAVGNPWEAFALTSVAGPSAIVLAMVVHRRVFKKPAGHCCNSG